MSTIMTKIAEETHEKTFKYSFDSISMPSFDIGSLFESFISSTEALRFFSIAS